MGVEMTQTLYTYMNKRKNKLKINKNNMTKHEKKRNKSKYYFHFLPGYWRKFKWGKLSSQGLLRGPARSRDHHYTCHLGETPSIS
jgi:hypothetical protein